MFYNWLDDLLFINLNLSEPNGKDCAETTSILVGYVFNSKYNEHHRAIMHRWNGR